MNRFTQLFVELDRTNKTNEKIEAMRRYFREAPASDAAWALYFLSGRKPKQIVPSRRLRIWAMEAAGIEPWLFDECRNTVGDSAETISLLLPAKGKGAETALSRFVEKKLLPIRGADEAVQKEIIEDAWNSFTREQIFVLNKIISGAFRIGVSQKLVMRALSQEFDIPVDIIALRLMGDWNPEAAFYKSVIDTDLDGETPIARPYPFHLAYQVDVDVSELGPVKDWQVEWKYDGIRCQVIKREGEVFLWSRGEDLINDAFPEVAEAASLLPDGTVLDGEILAFRDGAILEFQHLQRRIGRKKVSRKLLGEVPVAVFAYDLLEHNGDDIRQRELRTRRMLLEKMFDGLETNVIVATEPVRKRSWSALEKEREKSRKLGVEGFMLKRFDAPYRAGRQRGDWWKWKVDPFTVDAVLIYAQKGSGRRANLFTDYTFAVWNGNELVTFAKAYSGLTDAEIRRVDHWVRRNTKETFGPVRSVEPKHVFEIAFDGIQESKRHKSGVAVRFPRISRWREDKSIQDADSLETIKNLLRNPPAGKSE